MDKIFEEEKIRLEKVVNFINKKIEESSKNFEKQQNWRIGFSEGKKGTQFIRQAFMSMYATEENKLRSMVDNPYFGRFDFETPEGVQKIYIGKQSLIGDNLENLVFDWRSNIASMYYDFNIGDAEYISDNKKVQGKILNKRQINISNGELIKVNEHDSLNEDKILLACLEENSDAKLKSIISTIQKEQNKIIRNDIKNNSIIQGVAGSGKTTVALHRIAYLLYNDAKNLKESNFMIIGPNKFFLNYIAELLPELDIGNIIQNTFEDIFSELIKGKHKIESKNKVLEDILLGNSNKEVINFKSSIDFIKRAEEYTEQYIKNKLQNDIVYNGITLATKEDLKSIYEFVGTKSYIEKCNIYAKSIIKKIKENSEDISHNFWLKYRDEFLALDKDDPKRQEIIDYTNEVQKEIKLGCPKAVKEYFKFININPVEIYKEFINTIEPKNETEKELIENLKKQSKEKLDNKLISYEDLAPIMAINLKLNGTNKLDEYTNIFIDEAQDLSYAQYYILKKYFTNSKFELYGDINQSIYNYCSIDDWSQVNSIIFNDAANMETLNKCYRNTLEVSNASNLVLEHLGEMKADCIARSGSKVNVLKNDFNKKIDGLLCQINYCLDNNCKNIGIICKDIDETNKLYNKLKKLNLNINKITTEKDEYNVGVSILPSYLSKGLEFDGVIINNANSDIYTESETDMKLLYVALTRSMNELFINYSDELTLPLKPLINEKENINKLILNN